jgi:uncharacterized protein YeaO (DUF488 family)
MAKRAKHEITIKRVYDAAASTDGTRVLVDRMWPRGVTKQRAAIDLWLKEVAPSADLRKWFGHDPERWPEFQKRYVAELRSKSTEVKTLRDLLAANHVTLLFGAHDVDHNNAVVLAHFLGSASKK